jgi:hypothetical protein
MATTLEKKKALLLKLKKCKEDPIYFFKEYCYISHPQKGKIKFETYPFQDKVLKALDKYPYSIILKSRQLGISTLAAGRALHLMIFNDNKNVLALATTQATARNLVSKVRFMYDNLPAWLKPDAVEDNKLSLVFKNGSGIKAKSSSPDAARSEAVSLLIIDEAAFIDNIEETWASAQQTLATGGGAIVLSTPNGIGNWFHQMWAKAEAVENDFIPIRLPWDLHPERDKDWRKKQDELLGLRMAAQECDCNFNSSGTTVFMPESLEYIEKMQLQEPLERRGRDANYWIFEHPDYTKDYVVVADVARGDGNDYSAFHIFDLENNVQVAEYKGQIPTKDYGYLLVEAATYYNKALLVVENASIGWSTLQTIQEIGYQNLYYTPRGEATIDSYYDPYADQSASTVGFTMSSRNRPMIVAKMAEYVDEKAVTIRSKRTLSELRVFIWNKGKAEAQKGYNDDLVMSLGIGMYIRDTALRYRQRGIDITKSALANIQVNRTPYQGGYNNSRHNVPNPYEIDLGDGGKENINWLL